MIKPFDNGIDLSNFLWRPVEYPGSGELHKGDGDAIVEPSLSEVAREHNAVIVQLAEQLSKVTHFQFSESVSIIWKRGNQWSVFEAA
jgi:hypothetical protein